MTEPVQKNDSAFDEYAEHYGSVLQRGLTVSGEGPEFFARGRIEWLKMRLDQLGVRPARVLDFGCGIGISIPSFFEVLGAEQVTGSDLSDKSLAFAREQRGNERAHFVRLDYQQAPEEHDLVYCNGVFHHIRPDQRAASVEYIFRALRPGGLFALWENNPWNPGARFVMSRIAFDRAAVMLSAREAAGLLRAAGFEILRTDFQFVFPRALGALRRLEPLLAPWPLGAQYQVLARKPDADAAGAAGPTPGLLNPVQWTHDRYVRGRRVRVLTERIARMLPPDATVLDVGTGDGWLAREVMQLRRDVRIEGIDVLVRPGAKIPVREYDGRRIPYPDRSFDVVLFVDVLHHTTNAAELIREAVRVARRGVLIKDHACENAFDARTLQLMDRVGNERYSVALPFNYLARSQWTELFERAGASVESWTDRIGLYPAPVGWLFERKLHFLVALKPKG